MNTFQAVILAIFAVFTILGFLIFAGIIPTPFDDKQKNIGGSVTVWGVIPEKSFKNTLKEFNKGNKDKFTVTYFSIPQGSFDRTLVEALASNRGPDLILLPQNLIIRHTDKIFPISYESMSLRTFQDTYVEEGELYIRSFGILGLPFSVDPLVMYWNRDMFQSAGLVRPPQFWDEFFTINSLMTVKDETFNATKRGTAKIIIININGRRNSMLFLVIRLTNSRDRCSCI